VAVNRELIVGAALGILDEFGLADMSMRRIGDALGVQAATIYWHIPNKQALLAGVSDAILADVPVPVTDQPLAAGLDAWARSLRSVLLGHRDAAEVVAATLAVGLGERVPDEGCVAALRRAGWDEVRARQAARAALHFVLGHVTQEQTRRNLVDFGVLKSPIDVLDDEGFTVGLDIVVRGIAGWSPQA